MDEFNGIFDGDNFAAALAVDEVHHVIESGGFTGAGWAGHQHESVWTPGEVVNFFRQSQFFAGRDALAAESKAHFGMAVSAVKSGAHSSGHAVQQGDAQLPFLLELLFLLLVEQGIGHSGHVCFRQSIFISDDLAVDAKSRRHARDEVEIRSVEFLGCGKQAVEILGAHG